MLTCPSANNLMMAVQGAACMMLFYSNAPYACTRLTPTLRLNAGVARGGRIPVLITNPDGSYRKQKPWSEEWILERAKIRGEKERKNDETRPGHPEMHACAGLRSASRSASTLSQKE
jgi:hypothetical protein